VLGYYFQLNTGTHRTYSTSDRFSPHHTALVHFTIRHEAIAIDIQLRYNTQFEGDAAYFPSR